MPKHRDEESEAFLHWAQQHRAFVDYGIDLLLMFLEGRIRPGKGQSAAEQLKPEVSEQFSSRVERKIK